MAHFLTAPYLSFRLLILTLGMKILVIDDNQSVLRSLRLILTPVFGQVVTMADPRVIPALLAAGDVDAVLLDMNFGSAALDGSDGIFWLRRIMESPDPPAVVMITAFGDVPLAVEAMKLGAADFVTKPWDNDTLIDTLRRAVGRNREARSRRDLVERAGRIVEREDDEAGMSLDRLKLTHIRRVVDRCGGNLSQAAAILGINRQTLYNQLRKLQ